MRLSLIIFSCLILRDSVNGMKKTSRKKSSKKIMRIERFSGCPINDIVGTKFSVDIMDYGRGLTYLNANLTMAMNTPPILEGMLELHKCKTLQRQSCERMFKGKMDFCRVLEELPTNKDKFWAPILDFKPPVTCPLKSNSLHILRNGTIQADSFLSFLNFIGDEAFINHWYFKLELKKVKPPYSTFNCFELITKVETIRV